MRQTPTLTMLLSPIQAQMQQVNDLIMHELASNVGLIEQIDKYIIASGGKRLRPALVLLAAQIGIIADSNADSNADSKQNNNIKNNHHILLAAVIEFIHTATLLHDDVVDTSHLRRGKATANDQWGNPVAVLVGDFLYSRAFQMMVRVENMRVLQILAQTTNQIAEGEVLQLINARDPDVTEARYLDVIRRKTAILFAAATELGALMSDLPEQAAALHDYGLHLGEAFQLIDDVLDYQGDSQAMGKNLGDDLAEGKPTLPLIYAMQHGSASVAAQVRDAIRYAKVENLAAIQAAVIATGGLAYTATLAREAADRAVHALGDLPDSVVKQSLVDLAYFAVERVS